MRELGFLDPQLLAKILEKKKFFFDYLHHIKQRINFLGH